tara:strand:- start:1069 stop:1605 length:537 start_codon:yes stop_codon:yes gene_type:complete
MTKEHWPQETGFNKSVNERPFTILVVDDVSSIRMSTINLLDYIGKLPENTRFIEAEDGQEGLRAYMFENPDVIITDREMPNKNGFEMVEDIRCIQHNNIDGKTPLILMQSAISNVEKKEYLARAEQAGVDKAYVKMEEGIYQDMIEHISNHYKKQRTMDNNNTVEASHGIDGISDPET